MTETMIDQPDLRHRALHQVDFRWDGVEVLAYKQEGSAPFLGVTRQVLFDQPELASQLRYFEVSPGGHSTLERHEHVHGVVIVRGCGDALVGTDLFELRQFDLITVPPMNWHQFRAQEDEPLGFLCLVNQDRDRPQLPNEGDLNELRQLPKVASFIRF